MSNEGNILDFGTVELPDWDKIANESDGKNWPVPPLAPGKEKGPLGDRLRNILSDITHVRTTVRKMRYGLTEPVDGYRVKVVWPSGESHEWSFDKRVGWPIEDGKKRDWNALWKGVA